MRIVHQINREAIVLNLGKARSHKSSNRRFLAFRGLRAKISYQATRILTEPDFKQVCIMCHRPSESELWIKRYLEFEGALVDAPSCHFSLDCSLTLPLIGPMHRDV